MKNKPDARSLSREIREHTRNLAISMHCKGAYPDEIAMAHGISVRQVYRWIALYLEQGLEGLKMKKASGPGSSLSDAQLQRLAEIIVDHTPNQYQFEFALWTLNRVKAVILSEFNVDFSFQWVSVLLKRLGFSPQRPKLRASQRDEAWVAAWMTRDLPELKARAAKEEAEIWYGDESSVRSQEATPRTWSRKGQTPIITKSAERYSVNLISAICGSGELEFMAVQRTVNSQVFCEFLERLITGRKKKIILVIDNSSVHKSELVREFVAANSSRLELVFLPPYCPDANPDEFVWSVLKKQVRSIAHKCRISFVGFVNRAMAAFQEQPQMIKNFVRHTESVSA
jgi:transposase